MLANNLTLDDEDAVQEELRAIQKDIVKETIPIKLPDVPDTQPVSPEQGMPVFVVTNFSNLGMQTRDRFLIEWLSPHNYMSYNTVRYRIYYIPTTHQSHQSQSSASS